LALMRLIDTQYSAHAVVWLAADGPSPASTGNTLDSDSCVEALQEALAKYGAPEIFNTDQGSQFTSVNFTSVLKQAEVQISMDGKGRWMDQCLHHDRTPMEEYSRWRRAA